MTVFDKVLYYDMTVAGQNVKMKATMNDVINTIHAHPSVGEAVREAVMAANGNPIHIH